MAQIGYNVIEQQGVLCMKKNVAIGLMGGSFDPIHLGHIEIAKQAKDAMKLEQVWFIPSGRPPHKAHLGAAAAQRLEMTRLAIEELAWASACDIEVFREGTIYTVDTLGLLTAQYPETTFYYIIGADTLVDLPNWRSPEKVCSLCEFICIKRPGIDDATVQRAMQRMETEYGKRIYLIDVSGPDISSTEIRNALAAGENTQAMLPEAVRDYIDRENLYRS